MFPSILIIFREYLNINTAYIKHKLIVKTLKCAHKIFTDTIKFVYSRAELVHSMRGL
jgi:hypothetical protein